jgi:IS30 family transposase
VEFCCIIARRHRRTSSVKRAGGSPKPYLYIVAPAVAAAAVEDRAVPGHWEGDLLTGSKNSYIATFVERQAQWSAQLSPATISRTGGIVLEDGLD